MKIDGGCHCGFIAYEAEVDPEDTGICHCSDCQSGTGTAFRVSIPVSGATFRMTGQPTIYIKTTAESGNPRAQAFCPTCGSPVILRNGIEVGNIFKLGTDFTEKLGATYLAEDGSRRLIVMGSYGIGLGRAMACIVEAHHGTVEVSSSADSGASFVLYLPAQPAPIAADEDLKEVAS